MFGNPKHYYVRHMQKSQIHARFLRNCESPSSPGTSVPWQPHSLRHFRENVFTFHSLRGIIAFNMYKH